MASPAEPVHVLAVGECMVELRHRGATKVDLGFAGDTYNTAVYLHRTASRLGLAAEVAYLTGLSDDPYSRRMRDAWREEGITDRSITLPGSQPGLYAVNTDAMGERSFTYWRSTSAASALFSDTDWVDCVEADLVHFSGVTLQLMSRDSLERFTDRLNQLRHQGVTVSFDTNFRPSAWREPDCARYAFARAAEQASIVLASGDDELSLWGDRTPSETADRYRKWGAREVIVKSGERGAAVYEDDQVTEVAATTVPMVVDTTAAGDSFAGAYLAARLAGMSPEAAAALGSQTAAVVIQSSGAIVART